MSGLAIDVQKLLHLPYTTVDGVELLVDILRPTTGQRSGPAIIYVHGGGWAAGHRSDTPNDVLAKHGFTMLSISYRLSGRYLFPAALHDVKAAIRWTKAHANDLRIDPDRLGIWGHSAGGHLASLAALTSEVAELESHRGPQRISSRVQAAVPLAGPSWFPAESMHRDAAVAKLLGAHQIDDPELAELASPAAHVGATSPPFLLVHGEADGVVPLSQSQILDERLRESGRDSELISVTGAGHDYHDLLTPEVTNSIASFFDRHLGN